MSNEHQHPSDHAVDHEPDAWANLGLDDAPAHEGGAHEPGADGGFAGAGDDHDEHHSEVVDIEETPKKPKSKVGIYVGVAVACLVALAIVGAIVSKVMSVMSPRKSAEDIATAPGGDIKPLDGSVAPAIPGGIATQDSAGPQEQVLPGGNGQIPAQAASAPTAPPVAGLAPANTVGQAAGNGQPPAAPAPAVVATPAVGTTPPVAAACPVVDTSAKDSEIASLKSSLESAKARVHELEAKQQSKAAEKSAAKAPSKPAVAAARNQSKVARGKPADTKAKADVKEAAESPAAPVASAATATSADKKDQFPLSAYRITAIFPNTGDYKAAHLIDPNGKNAVVRVGDKLRNGATVTKIDVDAWRVQTSDGEIR